MHAATAAEVPPETRACLDPTRATHRESLVWVVPAPAEDLTTFVYTWVNSQGLAGAAMAAFGHGLNGQIFEKVDQIQVPDDMSFSAWEVGPLKARLAEDGMSSTVSFSGHRVDLDLEFTGFHPPYRYGTHPQGCPSFFADDRVEQSGLAKGTLRVDGRTVPWTALTQRDHSWGDRDWGAMHHMKWTNALCHDGTAVHAVEILGFGQRYLRGYLHLDGRLEPLTALDLAYDLDGDLLHTAIDATFTDVSGRSVDVRFADGGPHFEWDVNPRLTLRDTAMRATVDGRAADAYVDMSWHPEYLHYNAAHNAPTRIES